MGDEHRNSVAVGFFDGVHLGHRELLRFADAAITFRDHPFTVLAPKRVPKMLMPTKRRISAIAKLVSSGKVLALDFTPELAKMPAEEFARKVFFPPSHPDGLKVICGENWCFGEGGKGDAEMLRAMGLEVSVVPSVMFDGAPISSTRIREVLAQGHPEVAHQMLGHAYNVVGKLVAGKGIGAEIGYPTFNIEVADLPIRYGVYSAKLFGHPAIANYGVAPTCGDRAWSRPMLEVHVIRGEWRMKYLRFQNFKTKVSFRKYIREERKFESMESLAKQIGEDIKAASVVEWQTRGI